MRSFITSGLCLLAACGGGSATEAGPVRYNFAVVDGRNQSSSAGASSLPKPIVTQLTKDPGGKFATRILDFVQPSIAYAQGLSLSGTPVANAIVCGREAQPGEPQVVPLCGFTLADGKAVNAVKPGTKAGTFQILFTAQVPSQQPVLDSTTVVVEPGPMTSHLFPHGTGYTCWTAFPEYDDRFGAFVRDQYGNAVPYRFVTTGPYAHVKSDVIGSAEARTFVADKITDAALSESQAVSVDVVGVGIVAAGKLTVPSLTCGVTLSF